MDERVYLELKLSKSVEENDTGYIIEAEASNENLDFQEQVVLQRALMNSKEYFLKNGVISWDHLHKRKDENGVPISDPEMILGEPLSVSSRGGKTFVKALLYKGNRIVEDLVSKWKSGASIIKTSVGGMRPMIQKEYDPRLGKSVEKVISVLWDELALTFKPVNQTLSSVQFVKSLQLGYGTDSAGLSGGRSLVPQDLDGAGKEKNAIKALIAAMAGGEIRSMSDAKDLLAEHGIDDTKADEILKEAVARRKTLKEGAFFMSDKTLAKSFDDAVSELEKALKNGDGAPMPPQPKEQAPDPEMFEEEPEDGDEGYEGDEGHAEPDGDEDGSMEGDGDGDEPPAPPMKKSQFDDDVEFLDVSPVLASMSKSLQTLGAEIKAVRAENAELRKSIAAQADLVKSIGGVQLQTAELMKSFGAQPEMRKSVVTKQTRQFSGGAASPQQAEVGLTRDEVLRKSGLAVKAGRMSAMDASIIEDRLNKGIDIPAPTLELLKSIV